MLSYAMAMGSHHHMGTAFSMDHSVHHAHMSLHSDGAGGVAEKHDAQESADESNVLDNCCATPACMGAIFSTFSLSEIEVCSSSYITYENAFISIILPADRKPPRQ